MKKVFVAGHNGMVGSSICRALKDIKEYSVITRSRDELDLTSQKDVQIFFEREEFDQVYLAAAKVGGIYANNEFPANFIYSNLMIQANIINSAFESGVRKLLFLGSSCIYPKMANQPISEDSLLTGLLEPTNEPYAVAKIAGIKLCESFNRQYGESNGVDFRSVMPTNLYGIGDNYHPNNSHVIPGLIHRFHQAKINNSKNVDVWGSGMPRREFLYVDDLAAACIHVMNIPKNMYNKYTKPMLSHVNVGYGSDIMIRDLARLIASTVGYDGEITYDKTKPDGTPKKLMDSSLINNLGWKAQVNLEQGLKLAYEDYLKNEK